MKQLKVYAAVAAVLGGVAIAPVASAQVVKVDGSSTVFPVTEAVAEDFQKAKKGATKVTVGISGTGGGAFRARLPVEGKVERANKGGYEVRIAGQRAFCPVSQIDTLRNTDPSSHEGRVNAFRILEFKDGGKNLVVSRRAHLEEEQREQAEEVRPRSSPGRS